MLKTLKVKILRSTIAEINNETVKKIQYCKTIVMNHLCDVIVVM